VAAIRSNRHRTDEIQRWSSVGHSKALHLANVGAQCAQLAEQAVRERRTHLSFLEALLQAELEEREQRLIARPIRESASAADEDS
jgi:hypothetical protein